MYQKIKESDQCSQVFTEDSLEQLFIDFQKIFEINSVNKISKKLFK